MELNWVQLLLSKKGVENLRNYLLENLDLIPYPKTTFHSTILHSRDRPLVIEGDLVRRIDNSFPIRISPDSYSLNSSRNILFLRYEDPSIAKIYNQIMSNGTSQPTPRPKFIPHIIISKNFSGDVENLPPFKTPLTFNSCYWEI